MTQTKMRNTIDETYKKLRNKLKTDEEITESDLLESLKLYEITNKELKKQKINIASGQKMKTHILPILLIPTMQKYKMQQTT
ncbi:hypothetical protein HB838_11190 [Listeria seeligeri]|uniref:hypothetical protein n=1 Tax=Listeria seeligeri TaxID=1640 RepID=UPI00164E8578|nr:hypothetical protein [Listeria seeligeri]MBC6115417.1 hypothetical protein [Listeria seeligeri]